MCFFGSVGRSGSVGSCSSQLSTPIRPIRSFRPIRKTIHLSLPTVMRSTYLTLVLLVAACGRAPVTAPAPRNAPYDVVIRNGRVLDGAGNPWILADVGIRDGRFAKIGVIPERGRTEID